jgi:ferritin-like metal-binding protein YciE
MKKTLQDLFLHGLADIYDAEHRVIKAMPEMIKAATSDHLQKVLHKHLKETESHLKKLEHVFEIFEVKAKRSTCETTTGLLAEGKAIIEEFTKSPAINAALISVAQMIEHHEIAIYGCLHEWASLLGHKKAADLLQEILSEEEASNQALIKLARTRCNEEALADSTSEKAANEADNETRSASAYSRSVKHQVGFSLAK